ncbi:hypothetical protein I7I50_02726 [Histoplasma capsulatum G186AR]|uniref:Uncharacterized protein n=1 Tax=Ajellomyces capsulatus TaxID=5037 RepID=A0A8H7Z2X7_AJECA|nr:hypothetical protein I7I52_00608 [Histoplasma capsulatum]QSS71758.1 hypothetical protein I7I50_02726 [Histoplasma capsulatum G186AR]
MEYDNNCTGEDSGRPHSRNSSAEYEGDGIWSGTANRRANFKQDNGEDEDPFGRVEGVDLAEDELGGAVGDEVDAAVPADVFEGF